jgi:hypothetical protein
MLFEEPATRLSSEKWGRGPKGQIRARMRTFVLGTACSRFYDIGRNKMEVLKIMTNQ